MESNEKWIETFHELTNYVIIFGTDWVDKSYVIAQYEFIHYSNKSNLALHGWTIMIFVLSFQYEHKNMSLYILHPIAHTLPVVMI